MDSVEKYNELIRKTDSIEKLQDLFMKFAEDPLLTPERFLVLSNMMERDLFLVHNKTIFSTFQKVVEGVVEMVKQEVKHQ